MYSSYYKQTPLRMVARGYTHAMVGLGPSIGLLLCGMRSLYSRCGVVSVFWCVGVMVWFSHCGYTAMAVMLVHSSALLWSLLLMVLAYCLLLLRSVTCCFRCWPTLFSMVFRSVMVLVCYGYGSLVILVQRQLVVIMVVMWCS